MWNHIFEMRSQKFDASRSLTRLQCELDQLPLLDSIWHGNLFCGSDLRSNRTNMKILDNDFWKEMDFFFFV